MVTGRQQVLAGEARTASEGVVGQMDLAAGNNSLPILGITPGGGLSMPNSRALPPSFAGSFGATGAGEIRGGMGVGEPIPFDLDKKLAHTNGSSTIHAGILIENAEPVEFGEPLMIIE